LSDGELSVRCRNLSYGFGPVLTLRDLNFDILRGELACLVGPPGSGKSTLLRLMRGQLRPRSGRLWVEGVEVRGAGAGQLRQLRRRVGAVFRDYPLLESMTAIGNIAYVLRIVDLRMSPSAARRRALDALEQVGLHDRRAAYPRELRPDQRQRLALARARAARPALLLADEPTERLDEDQSGRLVSLLAELADQGLTVLMATSDAELAAGTGGRVLELVQGWVADERTEPRPRPAARPMPEAS
jgi:ABC-type ATPase involved in cell division